MRLKGPQKDEAVARAKVLKRGIEIDPESYEVSAPFVPASPQLTFNEIHTMPELRAHVEKHSSTQIDGHIIEMDRKKGIWTYRRVNRDSFRSMWDRNSGRQSATVREAGKILEGTDTFARADSSTANSGLVGDDSVPFLGGPFNKQQYLSDYLRAHSYAFYEYNHHPVAKAVVDITTDFTLGRGFAIDCEDTKALAYWKAFEEVNDLQSLMEHISDELTIFGEIMWQYLPGNELFFAYGVPAEQQPPKGLIPRIAMLDPSSCWEVITYPEDIRRVLAYQFVFPTQYQMFTTSDQGKVVPTSKFIMQQLPAARVRHFRVNAVSNEKRGRSDYFGALGYMKRLKDSVNYELISLQKRSAWAIDTTIEGGQSDIDNYVDSQQAIGTIPPAGSEFVHTAKIKREYQGSHSSHGGKSDAFEWALSMCAMHVRIPISYLGSHLSGGTTKASALVATEPVAKKFERRQILLTRILKQLWQDVIVKGYGFTGAQPQIIFPEIIVQDRSAKIKDIKLSEDSRYISRERAATMVAKELGISDYDYDSEKEVIDSENPQPIYPNLITPLTLPAGAVPPPDGSPAGGTPGAPAAKPGDPVKLTLGAKAGDDKPAAKSGSAVTKDDKKSADQQDGARPSAVTGEEKKLTRKDNVP